MPCSLNCESKLIHYHKGEKIKRVRLHCHMKQRESGELVVFTDGAANRIAQYESVFRVPKEDMVKK